MNLPAMGDYWSVIGILISVGLFLIGYRQTIGAKKQRVSSANGEVEQILVRRIVLEGYTPQLADIARFLAGKAQDFQVRTSDLLSEEQLLTNIFTRILETDLLPHDKRDEILKRLNPVIIEAEGQPLAEQTIAAVPPVRNRLRTRTAVIMVMGLMTSVLGALTAALVTARGADIEFPQVVPLMIATLTASVAIIGALAAFIRLRESQEETSKAATVSRYIGFEREVAKVIAELGGQPEFGSSDGYDFELTRNGKKILIEVKAWVRPMPARLIAQIANRLRQIADRMQATEAIIVTPSPVEVPEEVIGPRVRLMTLRDLRNYLAHATRD